MRAMAVPKFLKRCFTRRGLWISRKSPVLLDQWERGLRLDASFVIAHRLIQKSPLSFIQIGSYDGTQNDVLAPFVRRGLLKGLMIEPEPGAFAKLQSNCGHLAGVLLANIAVAERNGNIPMYRVRREFWHLHEAAPQLTSLSPDNIHKAGRPHQ